VWPLSYNVYKFDEIITIIILTLDFQITLQMLTRWRPSKISTTESTCVSKIRTTFVKGYVHIHLYISLYRIGGVMVSVIAASVVDRGFEPWSGKTKDYKIGMCCFSAKHVALRRKSKDWLARNQDNVSEWATCLSADCCFSFLQRQYTCKQTIKKIQLSAGLVQSRSHHHLIKN
jgi:hypothetical protein